MRHIVVALRDPMWQAISVLVAILGLIISLLVAYDIYYRTIVSSYADLAVKDQYWYNFPLSDSENLQIEAVVNDVRVKTLVVHHSRIENTGFKAIAPDEFIEPITMKLDAPWEILAVHTTRTVPDSLEVEWTRVSTNTFQLKPLLMNSGDAIEVLAYLTYSNKDTNTSGLAPAVEWYTRAIGVKSLTDAPPTQPITPLIEFFDVSVEHRGIEVYVFALLSVVISTLSVAIASKSGLIHPLSPRTILWLVFLAIMSVAASEIITDLFMDSGSVSDTPGQPLIGWLILGVFIILCFALLLRWLLVWLKRSAG